MNVFVRLKDWVTSSKKNRNWFIALLVLSSLITVYLMISSGSAVSASDASLNSPLYYFGVLLKLAAVLAMILGGAVLLRRWQGKQSFSNKTKQLQVVETVRLSPRQAIHLVRVGDQHILIGATDQNIAMLTRVGSENEEDLALEPEISETLSGEPAQPPLLNFDLLLQTMTHQQPTAPDESNSYDRTNHA